MIRNGFKLIGVAALVAGALVCRSPRTEASQITFSDSTFLNTDWGANTFYSTGGATISNGGQHGSFGNPSPSRFLNATLPGPGIVVGGNYNAKALVDPSLLLGPITGLDFQYDYYSQVNDGDSNYFSRTAPAVLQNGVWYTTSFPSMHTFWETLSGFTNLTATNFVPISGVGNPDFSPTGAPFYLGYANYFSSGTFGGNWSQFADNWSATVRFVPEPSTLWLGGVAALILVAAPRCLSRKAKER